jgi:hypothetical protein
MTCIQPQCPKPGQPLMHKSTFIVECMTDQRCAVSAVPPGTTITRMALMLYFVSTWQGGQARYLGDTATHLSHPSFVDLLA